VSDSRSTGAPADGARDPSADLSDEDLQGIIDGVEHGLKAMTEDEAAEETTDTTRRIEETETGYRLTVKSTRGTGTRDQDKVSLVAKTESLPDPATVTDVCDRVRNAMNQRRAHEPDSGGEE
jgi:hypothetical protein